MDQLMACGIALIVGLILIVLSLRGGKKKKLPPGPFAWPVVGNLFLRAASEAVREHHERILRQCPSGDRLRCRYG
jgi:hypothetical protein